MNEQVQKIHANIFKKRLSPNKDYSSKWEFISLRDIKKPLTIDEKIEELLKEGKKVKGGYFCTSVRDYHEHYLMVKRT